MEGPEIIEIDKFNWQIPVCCSELHDDCPHVIHKKDKKRINKGL